MSQALGCYEVQYPDIGWADQQLDLKCQATTKVVIFWVVVIVVIITTIILKVLLVDHGYPIRTLHLLCSSPASVVPPLPVMKKVVQTKSAQGVPLLWPMASLLNGAIWVSYAQIGVDFVLLVPWCDDIHVNGSNGNLWKLLSIKRMFCYLMEPYSTGMERKCCELSRITIVVVEIDFIVGV